MRKCWLEVFTSATGDAAEVEEATHAGDPDVRRGLEPFICVPGGERPRNPSKSTQLTKLPFMDRYFPRVRMRKPRRRNSFVREDKLSPQPPQTTKNTHRK